ncbi:MAG: FAD-binding oxidoreductase [bacterium]|nr:FAD-binding oxidoreductase [bacterium]
MPKRYQSWGRYPRTKQDIVKLHWRSDPLPLPKSPNKTILPYGNGRSYGDSCLNDGGVLLDTRGLDRLLAFDRENGILRCEAGVLLSEILALVVPHGWFVAATPGTQLVTVGGAIANDVHGKGHHRDGTFGQHVRCFELLRSDGTHRVCSPTENSEWFAATIGGLGLTGLIVWAEIALKPIANPYIEAATTRFDQLDSYFTITRDADSHDEYTVAWIDCLAQGNKIGRGIFTRGNHASQLPTKPKQSQPGGFPFPVEPPLSLINSVTLRAFNMLYYHSSQRRSKKSLLHYRPFFYPLDAIDHWNRIYGPKGFMQYQCVVPFTDGQASVRELLERIARSRQGSFLAVLKTFGDQASPGLMSFPRPGVTLALDFPNRGDVTLQLLSSLDEVVRQAGGAVYPAKDARMSGASFRAFFPQWESFANYIDANFSSSFWRRVTGDRQ